MLTSKQRAFLRSLSVNIDTILIVGKNGINEEVIHQAREALAKRELIKGKVLIETSPLSVRETAEKLAEATKSELVQVIGSKFCLYKHNHKEPKILLPKSSKK